MRNTENRHDIFRASLVSHLRSLVTRRDYAGAVEFFEENRALVTETKGSPGAQALHEVARAYYFLTNYSAALSAARIAQARATDADERLLMAEIFLTIGKILRDSGKMADADRALRDAESIFRRNDAPEGQSRALNQLAGLSFIKADYKNALGPLMDAVTIAKKLDDKNKLAYMMGNVGRIHTFLGNFAEAEKHLQINIELSDDLGDDLESARARLSLAYVYLQRDDYAETESSLDAAYRLIAQLNVRREEIIYLTYLGELRRRMGRFDEAREILKKALAMAERECPDSILVARALRHLAELEVNEKQFRAAGRYATRAQAVMNKVGDNVEKGALLKVLAQVSAAQSAPARARKQFQQAIDLLDESGVRWEKADALMAAGVSAAFEKRQRMTYLFRAEEFFSRSRLDKKLRLAERLIAQLTGLEPQIENATHAPLSAADVDYRTACLPIARFKEQAPLLGRSGLPLLITGETGVGKDHMARFVHSVTRPKGPYVAINCASVPETLLESELFGYHKGAFTGADGNKEGLFVSASGGVLLLDEIGDMPLSLQAKLLGVLEMREVTPLGSTATVDIDVVLIATTNRDLEQMVEEGTFRRDLFYRLSGISFTLPPLRERKEDIPLLLEQFMRRQGILEEGQDIQPEVVSQFLRHEWPGNIRELDNKVKRMSLMSNLVAEGDLSEVANSLFATDAPGPSSNTLFERVEQFERQIIVEALLASRGNKSRAARMLGIHEATVRTKLKRYGIEMTPSDYRGDAPN